MLFPGERPLDEVVVGTRAALGLLPGERLEEVDVAKPVAKKRARWSAREMPILALTGPFKNSFSL